MGDHKAEHLFWELVEDFGEKTVHTLADHESGKLPIAVATAIGVTMTTVHLLKAVNHAAHGDWEKAADSCSDVAGSAINVASGGNFGAAKGLAWDLAVTAHLASGKSAPEAFSEVQKHLLHHAGDSAGNKAFEILHPGSVRGDGAGVAADFYSRHPELYQPHVEHGKLHFDRLVADDKGQKHPAHLNFTTDTGQRIHLEPGETGSPAPHAGAPDHGQKSSVDMFDPSHHSVHPPADNFDPGTSVHTAGGGAQPHAPDGWDPSHSSIGSTEAISTTHADQQSAGPAGHPHQSGPHVHEGTTTQPDHSVSSDHL